jgi:hypothetical protein
METVRELYETQLRSLPLAERLRLAQWIVNDLVKSAPRWTIDVSDAWSDEDLRDLTRATLTYAARSFGEEDNHV